MKKWIIRKPQMYSTMREASFSPGVVTTLIITILLLVVYYIIREIPASLIDYLSLLSRSDFGPTEGREVLADYAAAPGTMLWSLSLTAIMFAIIALYVHRVEKRPLSTIGLSRQHMWRRFGFGWLLGALLMVVGAACGLCTGAFSYTGFHPVALLFIPAFIVQTSSEELLFRGFLLSSFTSKMGVVRAVLLSSALFALMRVQKIDTTEIPGIVEMFLFGIFAAFLTMRTNSLWMACGVHAASSFVFGLFFPVSYGHLSTNYSAFSAATSAPPAGWGALENLYTLPAIALDIVLIALVLFTGKKRLVVRPNETERMYYRALRIAKAALKPCRDEFGKPYIRRSAALSQKVAGDAESIAVLLADACNAGGLPLESLTGFSEDVLHILDGLIRRNETDVEYGKRIRSNPAAYAVWRAKLHYEEKLLIDKTRWDQRRSKTAVSLPDIFFCPMLRRDIHLEDCAGIIPMVDDYADDDAHASLRFLDRNICIRCARRGNR